MAYTETEINETTITDLTEEAMYTSIQVWRHQRSGERYVVQTDGEMVADAVGPLHYTEIDTAILDGFDGDPELVDDINAHLGQYVVESELLGTCPVCGGPAHFQPCVDDAASELPQGGG